MSHQIAPQPNGLSLAGRVDYSNAGACQREGQAILAALSADGAWTCELSALETGSSVTAAVLMAWQRFAISRNSTLSLTQAPERLVSILAARNLDKVFAVERTVEGNVTL